MIGAVICGLLVAAGFWAVVRGMFPAPSKLSRLASDFHDPAAAPESEVDRLGSKWSGFALALANAVQGTELGRLRQDLAVVGMSAGEFASDKLKAGVLGSAIVGGPLFAVGLAKGALLVIVVVAGFVGFYFYPDVDLRKPAVRRREFVDTVTAFIGLVSVSIAGGGGVVSAMNAAASLGDEWALERLRFVLDRAATRNESPWVALDELGLELGIPTLVELGGSMSLAAQSGAKISESLGARAQSARARELADRLAVEERKSEALGIPVVLMLLAWMGFLGFPAVVNIIGI